MIKPNFSTLIFLLFLAVSCSAKFKVFKEWDYVNFTWPNVDEYKDAVEQKNYVPENIILAGLKYFDGWYYITLPRMKRGVPATLTRMPANQPDNTSPLLIPYPSWEMNNVEDCNSLQNVQNVEIDTKGQIWIIDGGRTETLSSRPVVKCKPKLVVYDIKKNDNVLTYTFPEHVASFNGSFLYDIVVDSTDEGYAYITDNSGKDPGIIVFSVKDHHAWKIRHSQSMHSDPQAIFFRVNDVAISTGINLAGIALGPKIHVSNERIVVNEDREVFYAPLSSLHLYSINSSVLRDENFGSKDAEYQGHVKDYGLKSSQSVAMLMTNQGILYFNLLGTNSIAKWDSHTPFLTGQKVIAKDSKYLEWPASFCLDDKGNLTVLVNRLNRFIYGTLDTTKPNFRLISSNVGGQSYLFEEDYNSYKISTSKPETSTEEKTHFGEESEHPESRSEPGAEPEPEPTPKPEPNPEPEPSPEPEPTVEPSSESKPNNRQPEELNNSSTTGKVENKVEKVAASQEKPKSGSDKLRVSFLGIILAGSLFLV